MPEVRLLIPASAPADQPIYQFFVSRSPVDSAEDVVLFVLEPPNPRFVLEHTTGILRFVDFNNAKLRSKGIYLFIRKLSHSRGFALRG